MVTAPLELTNDIINGRSQENLILLSELRYLLVIA